MSYNNYVTNIVSDTLHYIGKNYSDTFVVQIGTMDGINFDDTRGFLDMYKWDALLVEPIPTIMEELQKNFSSIKNYKYEQSAITEFDGETVMLTIKNNILIPTSGIDESNANGYYILWPEKPFESAKRIYNFIKKEFKLQQKLGHAFLSFR